MTPPTTQARVVVRAGTSPATTTWSEATDVVGLPRLRWSPDGHQLMMETCAPTSCEPFRVLDVPGSLTGVPASPRFATDVPMSGRFAFDNVYLWVIARDRVEMLSALSPFEVDKEFALGSLRADQVIPTRAGIYVVGAEPGHAAGVVSPRERWSLRARQDLRLRLDHARRSVALAEVAGIEPTGRGVPVPLVLKTRRATRPRSPPTAP